MFDAQKVLKNIIRDTHVVRAHGIAPECELYLKQTRVEPDTVLSDEFPPILRQKCSKCASISPLSFLSRQKFIRLKLRRTWKRIFCVHCVAWSRRHTDVWQGWKHNKVRKISVFRRIVFDSRLLKPENLQITGSFKVRGSAYKIAMLSEEEKANGNIACSAGTLRAFTMKRGTPSESTAVI